MITIGRKDRVDLPEIDLMSIEAKIDTGAYGSAIHCHEIQVISKNGKDVLVVKFLDPSYKEYTDKEFTFEKFSDKKVRSSSGEEEHRYTIRTTLIIFEKEFDLEFSLSNRIAMKSPILLGRKFLKKGFLVNVKLKDLSKQLKNQNQ